MTSTGTVAEVSGVKLRLGGHLSPSIIERILSGNYEQDEMGGLSAVLAPGDVVMEIGAGIGFLSSHCAKVVGSENTYAFEANPELEAVIRDTYELNRVSPHLEICILAHECGERTFYLEDSFLVSSLTSQGQRTRMVKVPAKLLNAEIARIQPSVLMIDIEGGEYELFPDIDLKPVRKIVMELHPRNAERVKTRSLISDLYARGFVAYKAASHGDVLCMERRELLLREVLTLQEAINGLSSFQTDLSIEEVKTLIAPGESIAFIDPENRWTDEELSIYQRFNFSERDGVDWGAPADDETALRELERLRNQGVRYLVLLWSAFWWLETYPRLFQELQTSSRCLLNNARLIIFQLGAESSR